MFVIQRSYLEEMKERRCHHAGKAEQELDVSTKLRAISLLPAMNKISEHIIFRQL